MSLPFDLKAPLAYPKAVLRNYFAQRVVYPSELPGIMRKHIYTGAMGSLYFNLMGGIFFVYYGNAIGLSRFEWGIMGGLASFMLASQLLSALITERLGRRKLVWFASALVGRGIRVTGILGSLWLWHIGYPHPETVLIGVIIISTFFDSFAEPPWLSWLADIIPQETQGRFWGRRSAWIASAVVAVLVPAGLLLDRLPPEWKTAGVTGIFVLAGALGIIDLLIHGTLPEPTLASPENTQISSRLTAPILDREFRPWLVFNCSWQYSMTLGGSLSMLYFLDELGIDKNLAGGAVVLNALPLVGSIITGRWSGRLVDKAGTRRVLFWGHIFWGILPIFWIVSSPATALVLLGVSSIVGGSGSTAASTAANKIVTRLPRQHDRAVYAAVSTCLGNFAGGLGVLTAGTVLLVVGDWKVSILGWPLTAFMMLFVGSLVLRLATAVVLIKRIKEPRILEPAAQL